MDIGFDLQRVYNIIQLAEYAGKAQIVGNLLVFITVSIAFRTS